MHPLPPLCTRCHPCAPAATPARATATARQQPCSAHSQPGGQPAALGRLRPLAPPPPPKELHLGWQVLDLFKEGLGQLLGSCCQRPLRGAPAAAGAAAPRCPCLLPATPCCRRCRLRPAASSRQGDLPADQRAGLRSAAGRVLLRGRLGRSFRLQSLLLAGQGLPALLLRLPLAPRLLRLGLGGLHGLRQRQGWGAGGQLPAPGAGGGRLRRSSKAVGERAPPGWRWAAHGVRLGVRSASHLDYIWLHLAPQVSKSGQALQFPEPFLFAGPLLGSRRRRRRSPGLGAHTRPGCACSPWLCCRCWARGGGRAPGPAICAGRRCSRLAGGCCARRRLAACRGQQLGAH
jgi:hypothetical protein